MNPKAQKTPFQIEKEKKEAIIFREYSEMMALPDAMATAVEAYLMKRHSIHSRSTIHNIRAREQSRLKAECHE